MANPFDLPEHVPSQRLVDFTNDTSDLTDVEWMHIQNCPECREAYSGFLSVRLPEPERGGRILQFRPRNIR
jgi:hypothetical protein